MTKKEFAEAAQAMLASRGIETEMKLEGASLMLVHVGWPYDTSADLDGVYSVIQKNGVTSTEGIRIFADAFEDRVNEDKGNAKEPDMDQLAELSAMLMLEMMQRGVLLMPDMQANPNTGKTVPCLVYDGNGYQTCMDVGYLWRVYAAEGSVAQCAELIEDSIQEARKKETAGPAAPGWDDIKDKLFIALRPAGYENPETINMPLESLGLVGEVMCRHGNGFGIPRKASLENAGVNGIETVTRIPNCH